MPRLRIRSWSGPISRRPPSAVALAADWARSFAAQLHLVNGQARKKLATVADQLTGIDVHTRVLSAGPHDAIDRLAERVKADLIVTGSRGLSGLKHVVLG